MIDKTLNSKKTSYSSNVNEDNLKKKIKNIFEQRTLNVAGKFISLNEFAAYDTWTIIGWSLPNFKRKSGYLKGRIIKSGKETLIKLNSKLNSILSIFAILSVFIGIITTIAAELNKENNQFLSIGLIFITLGTVSYPIGIFLRNRLRNNFEKYLDLQKV